MVFKRPEVYLAETYLYAVAAALGTGLFSLTLVLLSVGGIVPLPGWILVLAVAAPFLFGIGTLLSYLFAPSATSLTRQRDIDAKLPYALNYISTVASAGMPPDQIFASLAQQPVYGEVSHEAGRISHDIQVLGKDLVTALSDAVDRTPSTKMQSFLQGAITALTSGEDLEQYFLSKSEQIIVQNRQDERQFLDSLGVLAESYVTVVVGAPVFLVVLLSMVFVFGETSPDQAIAMGYGLVLVLIPLAQAGFVTVIKTITPEV